MRVSPHTAQAPQRPIRDRPGCPYTWTSFAILTWQATVLDRPEEGAHRRVVEPPPSPICFPRLRCSPYALAKRHQSDVCSLSCRVTLKTRIRPITGRRSLFPTSQARTSISSPYGSPSLAGEDTGLPRFAPEVSAGLGTCCRPGSAVDHEVAPLNPPPAPIPFGSSLSATLARSRLTVVAQVHM